MGYEIVIVGLQIINVRLQTDNHLCLGRHWRLGVVLGFVARAASPAASTDDVSPKS
jgi:hypothetical protein